ncbi:MAG: hypothetical protein ACR2H5_20140 [Ktedonobacteraceae bacterium]
MYNNFVSNPMNQSDRKLTSKDIVLYIIVPIVVALIGTGAFFGVKGANSTPASQPVTQQASAQQATIPQLHGSYSGSANGLGFSLSGLVEQADGTFTSGGNFNGCNIAVSGNATETGIITFTAQQQDFNCSSASGNFSGNVTNNGGRLAGQWKMENTFPEQGGQWELS